MAGFDPDAYLAKTATFDPDAYLAKGDSGGFLQTAGNLAAGAVRGAGSIGATILTPYDLLVGNTKSIGNPERRKAMDEALTTMGAQPDSLAYKGAKLAGEIAGTAGAGGVLANGARVAGASPTIVNALASGGLSTGSAAAPGVVGAVTNALTRAGAGAAVGGVSAGMVNPADAPEGAAIGGALPGAVQVAGVAGKAAKKAIGALTANTLGTTTGAGAESVRTAYQAGKEGGTSFLDNMRGNVPFTDVLDQAKAALQNMRIAKSEQYKQGMAGVSGDKTVVDFTPIDQAVNSLKSMGNYKGQVINKNASGTVDEIADLVNRWKALDPAEYHTPEGLDALKQAISDIRDTTQLGTAGRRAADTAYNAVKGEIVKQAPTYSKVMKDYSEASELVKEIERSLSLKQGTAADTAMRKLQSLMRNNVSTNYGNRLDLARTLESNGAEVLPAVAGQALSSATPRGLQGLTAGGVGAAGLLMHNPAAIPALAMTSPRLVGEAAYGLGALNRGAGNAGVYVNNKLAQLLQRNGAPALTMNELVPLMAPAVAVGATQR